MSTYYPKTLKKWHYNKHSIAELEYKPFKKLI